jgi:ParB-like chromosome segregation protein Spo0J
LPIHPAANLIPPLSSEEFKDLTDDIKKNGLQVPVTLFADDNGNRSLLDGRHRLDALELAGRDNLPDNLKVSEFTYLEKGIDPYAYVISTNIHRRHLTLTTEQKRTLIAKLLKATPGKSNRQIGDIVKADHKTVGEVRKEGERTGEIPQLKKTTGKDGKTRTTRPAQRKGRQERAASSAGPGDGQPVTDMAAEDTAPAPPRANDLDTLGRQQTVKPPERTGLAGYAPPVPEILPEQVKAKPRTAARAMPTLPQGDKFLYQAADGFPQTEPAEQVKSAPSGGHTSNFAKLVEAWKICTPEEQRQLLNQNNAVILTGSEGLLLVRGFHVAALRDSDRQTRVRELRALLTAFDLTAHDLFLPVDVEQVDSAPVAGELAALQAEEPAQKNATPPINDLDRSPPFMDRRPGADVNAAKGSNGKAAS